MFLTDGFSLFSLGCLLVLCFFFIALSAHEYIKTDINIAKLKVFIVNQRHIALCAHFIVWTLISCGRQLYESVCVCARVCWTGNISPQSFPSLYLSQLVPESESCCPVLKRWCHNGHCNRDLFTRLYWVM